MPTSTIVFVIDWILLYSSIHFLSLKADKCFPSDPHKCGNLTFPYPFHLSTTENLTCGLPGFEISCKRKPSSYPGIPFLKTLTGEVQVLNISYDHIVVDAAVLYASSREATEITKTFNLSDDGPFRISEFNNFFATGCQTYGRFKTVFDSKSEEWPYSGSCLSRCVSNHTIDGKRLSCKGKGCCQIAIPGGYTRISLTARFYSEEIFSRFPIDEDGYKRKKPMKIKGRESRRDEEQGNTSDATCRKCACAVVDKDSWETISSSKTFTASRTSIRLDWAIPNDTCFSAQTKSSFQCSPKAECENKDWGYVCSCKTGYDGDGYTNGTGCTEMKNCKGFSCFQTLSIITGICGTLVAVLVGGGSFFWIFKVGKSKRDKEKNFKRNREDLVKKLKASRGIEGMELFSLTEMKKATNNFSQNFILGKGGFGAVYKGTLKNGNVVAVKKSKDVDSKEIDQFINELSILSQIDHRNVVKLLGCCLETSVPLLVYEYISNRTLFDHLHSNNEEQQQLSWEQRLFIATETAEALSYLHSAKSIPIVHRDVKSSNILLDPEYHPKVADFGASRLLPMGQKDVARVLEGTMGYLDPEYFQTFQFTEKSDVYSFGVVLVELLTGSKPVSYNRKNNSSNLAIFFLSTVNETGLRELIDPRLDVEEGKNRESMRRVAGLAKECLSVKGEKRPIMEEVVQELLLIKGGVERPHEWVNTGVADNPEELEGLIVREGERSDGLRSAHSISHQCSSSFSIEIVGDRVRGDKNPFP